MSPDKKPFETVKVIDPHKNMPGEIKRSFLDGIRERDGDMSSNDSFFWWTVGHYQDLPCGEDEDDLDPWNRDLKKVDDWMMENGLKRGEKVLVLYWW